jgi:hypothetical protein
MRKEDVEILRMFQFQLRFLEDGGYRRSIRAPWRGSLIFEDSPTCINFDAPTFQHPCSECRLMEFVPVQYRNEVAPCRFIPLTESRQTVDNLYRCGTQIELEEALACWLRKQIAQMRRNSTSPEPSNAAACGKDTGTIEKS